MTILGAVLWATLGRAGRMAAHIAPSLHALTSMPAKAG
jgi:hypothetical protein